MVLNDFQRVSYKVLDNPALATDPRFCTNPLRMENGDVLQESDATTAAQQQRISTSGSGRSLT